MINISKLILAIVLFFNGIPGKLTAQEPQKLLFDADWKFHLGDVPGAETDVFDKKNWRTLDLPHDWSIEGTLNEHHPTGNDGGYFPAGIGWYRKSFTIPPGRKGKKVSVYFEGVYMNAEVFINGTSLGIYPYGYSPFSYDLTPYLQPGKENTIAVRVDNSMQKNCRWYSGSGIYRHVWILFHDPVYVPQWGVAVSTPVVSSGNATVVIRSTVKNESGRSQSVIIHTQLTGPDLKQAGGARTKLKLEAHSEKLITQTVTVPDPLLWNTETPHLYQAEIDVIKGNKTIDRNSIPFGIRSLHFSTGKGFQLNGKTIKINGGCVHHDNGCLGAAAYNRAEERRVEILKAAGFNAIRTSHNIPSEAFLNACDRLGMLVIDEAFDGWREKKNEYDYAMYFDQWWKRDIESMVYRDRNHPSIIMWSTGNEIIERKKPEAVATAKMLADHIRGIDSTRPVTSAMTTWDNDWEIFDPLMAAHDVCGYNYQLHRAMADHERVPSRVIVQTESYPRDAFANWKLVQDHDYIIGDFVWTALDYLGESGIGRWYYSGDVPGEHWDRPLFPWHGAYCGDIDLTGQRKAISHYRSMLYNKKEKLYLAVREPRPVPLEIKETMWSVWPTWESWTWPGYEGKNLEVEVCSLYPKIRLYLDNKLIAEKATTGKEEFKAIINVPYAPGVLKAVGVEDNNEVETKILLTAGKASGISLTADRSVIHSDGQDLSFITVLIKDQKGNIQPGADNELTFTVTGAGVIAGLDNGNLRDPDPYMGTTRKAWKGRALLVIKNNHLKGDIRVVVSSPGLTGSEIILSAE